MNTYKTPSDEAYFSAVGRLTISWGQLDNSLDTAIMVIEQHFSKLVDSEFPISQKRKLRYLRKAPKLIHAILSHQENINDLSAEITKASATRQDIVHGGVFNHPPEADMTKQIQVVRFFQQDGAFMYRARAFTAVEVMQEALHVGRLAKRASRLSIDLLRSLSEQKPPIVQQIHQ